MIFSRSFENIRTENTSFTNGQLLDISISNLKKTVGHSRSSFSKTISAWQSFASLIKGLSWSSVLFSAFISDIL